MSTREELDIEIGRLEIQRLTKCLEAANLQAEHFERMWYLRGDAIEDALEVLQDSLRIKENT